MLRYIKILISISKFAKNCIRIIFVHYIEICFDIFINLTLCIPIVLFILKLKIKIQMENLH